MSERKTPTYRQQIDAERTLRIREICSDLPQACYDFLSFISTTATTFTRLAYALDLRTFFNFLHDERVAWAGKTITLLTDADLAELTTRDLIAYTEYLTYYLKKGTEQDLFPREMTNQGLAIKRKLCSVRALYDYLFQAERIPSNIAALVPLPKVHEKPIIRLSSAELEHLLHTVESGEGLTEHQKAWHKNTAVRDYAMLMLFLGTGIRVSECVGLNLTDVDLRDRAFVVTRKGGNQVVLYFNDEVAAALSAYLEERKRIEALPGHEQAFFLSLQRKRINLRSVQKLVKKYAAVAAPLKPRISPHKLRSTFATNLYQETGDIYLVADALGHSSVDTTRKHYADMSDRQRREAAEHVHLLSAGQTPALPTSAEERPRRAPAAPQEAESEKTPRRRRRAAETEIPADTPAAAEAEEKRSGPGAESPEPPQEAPRRRRRRTGADSPETGSAPENAQQAQTEAPPRRHRRAEARQAEPSAEEAPVRHRRSHRP